MVHSFKTVQCFLITCIQSIPAPNLAYTITKKTVQNFPSLCLPTPYHHLLCLASLPWKSISLGFFLHNEMQNFAPPNLLTSPWSWLAYCIRPEINKHSMTSPLLLYAISPLVSLWYARAQQLFFSLGSMPCTHRAHFPFSPARACQKCPAPLHCATFNSFITIQFKNNSDMESLLTRYSIT